MWSRSISQLMKWRWAPCLGLVLGSLAFVGLAIAVIPEHLGAEPAPSERHFVVSLPPATAAEAPRAPVPQQHAAIADPKPVEVIAHVEAATPVEAVSPPAVATPVEAVSPPEPVNPPEAVSPVEAVKPVKAARRVRSPRPKVRQVVRRRRKPGAVAASRPGEGASE